MIAGQGEGHLEVAWWSPHQISQLHWEQKAGPGHLKVARWTPHARQESQASFPQRPEQLKPVSAHTRSPRDGEVPWLLLKMA
ncbi:hypothetical protein V6N12_068958 [Hibiscus sabdariffa]|uniref:Uncharacterized protein n=1 Tax=Hibiscus sabdariffa TaxID=183260 RepID=A0ABR2CAA2_9ROSI